MAYAPLEFSNFAGGLNLLDDPQPNEAIDLLNVQIDRNARAQKRLGYAKDGSMSAFGSFPVGMYFSVSLQQIIVQEGVNVRKRTGAGTFTLIKAFSTSEPVLYADFNDLLLIMHPSDGLFSYNGTSVSSRLGTVNGLGLAVWQNKVWASEQDTLYYSVPGDAADWTGAGSGNVIIREGNDDAIKGLAASPRVGLLVFKLDTTYRVTSSETGAYVTIDPSGGTNQQAAVTILEDQVIVLNWRGVFITDGAVPLQKVSRKLDPIFGVGFADPFDSRVAYADLYRGRVFLSFDSTFAPLMEYDPISGSFVVHSIRTLCLAADDAGVLYHGGVAANLLYQDFTGGSDDGAAIAARYQTAWVPLNGRRQAWVQQLTCESRGDFSLYLRRDRESSGGTLMAVDGSTSALGSQKFYPRKLAREVSLRVEESSTVTGTEPKALSIAGTNTVGAFALHDVLAELTPAE